MGDTEPAHSDVAADGLSVGQAERLAAARAHCEQTGGRWTAPREGVFRLLLQAQGALKAYDLVSAYRPYGRVASPATVYRALDFLQAQGLVHRLETNNAYVACSHPAAGHDAQFAICDRCGTSEELPIHDNSSTLTIAGERGFQVRTILVELRGICPNCQNLGSATP